MQAQQATITVRVLKPMKAGGKFASVQDQTNNWWLAEPSKLTNVQVGQTIVMEYHEENWAKGPVQIINRVLDTAARVQGTQAPEGQAMQPMYRKNSVEESAEMFVRGVMCSVFHGLGTVPDARTIANMVYHLRQAWTAGFAADLKPLPERPQPLQAAPAAVEGFKQVGQVANSAVPETLRKSMEESLGGGVPF